MDDCQNCRHRLQNKSLFSCLPSSHFPDLEKHRSNKTFSRDQVLFLPDDQPAGIMCLQFGLVKLEAFSLEGNHQLVRLARPGEPLGYRAFVQGKRQKYRATALTQVRVCAIPQIYLQKAVETIPEFSQALLKRLSNDLEYAEERWLGLLQKNSKQRVAEVLLEFHGVGSNWPSRQDMACLIDMTPETFSRVLKDFENGGLIARTRKTLEILNPQGLNELCLAAGA